MCYEPPEDWWLLAKSQQYGYNCHFKPRSKGIHSWNMRSNGSSVSRNGKYAYYIILPIWKNTYIRVQHFWGLGTAPCSQASTLPAPTRKIRPGSPDSKAQTFTSEFRTFESTQLDSLALQKLRLGFSTRFISLELLYLRKSIPTIQIVKLWRSQELHMVFWNMEALLSKRILLHIFATNRPLDKRDTFKHWVNLSSYKLVQFYSSCHFNFFSRKKLVLCKKKWHFFTTYLTFWRYF